MPNPKSVSFGTERAELKDCIHIASMGNDANFITNITEIYSKVFFKNQNGGFGDFCANTMFMKVQNPTVMFPEGFEPEHQGYKLKVYQNGQIHVEANYQVGVLRAMDTLAQVLDYSDGKTFIPHLPLEIEDQPRYGYIGLLLDVSRQYYPIETLQTIIDGLRMSKVNVLHLHLTDDDSFPIDLPSFPGMADQTALTPEEKYTVEDLKQVIDYALKNGVKVIPEFDIPGHTRAISDDPAFEHLVKCANRITPWTMPDGSKIQGGPSSAVLDPSQEETYEFVDRVLNDFEDIFTTADFIHLGGDEVNTNVCWVQDPEVNEWMSQNGFDTGAEAFAHFQSRVGDLAKERELRTAHWMYHDNWDLQWDDGSIIQYWGDSMYIPTLKETYPDHQHILSVHDLFYFDCGLGNRYGVDLCNPYQTWARIRMFEPTDFYSPDSDQLLGGEGAMWSELNTPHNVFNKIWPRLAVIASIFWSEKVEQPFNWGDEVEQLVSFRDYLKRNGVEANQITSRY